MASQQWMMQVIEALNSLWTSLPLRGVTDERAALEAYGFALEGNSVEAVQNVVIALRRGEIDDASKDFCPKAPKLAEYVRAEQRRLDAVNRMPMVSYAPVPRPWVDWRLVHLQECYDSRRRFLDYKLSGSRHQAAHPGCVWYWSLGPGSSGSLYGAPGSAKSDWDIWGKNWEILSDLIRANFKVHERVAA